MATHRRSSKPLLPLLIWVWARVWSLSFTPAASHEFPTVGTVIELDEANFDSAIAAFDNILVDFYAPWCGHCKRLSPELDAAAPVLAKLDKPIVIAKINADKYRKLAAMHEIDRFPTLKIFMHGVPVDYTGPRKADLLVRFLKKFVAPDVSLLESDFAIHSFVEEAGTHFPIFIGFGLDESVIVELAIKYKKKAWFCVAKVFSEEIMVVYDFDKVPALVSLHPKYNEQSVFYGPFEGQSLEDFIQQNQLPLTVPINPVTLKLLTNDERKIVLTIMEDETDEKSLRLIKILRATASVNRDLVFGYVGAKQFKEFVNTFDITKSFKMPIMFVWDRNEDYHLVVGSESLEDEDQGSQISRFLEGYREGKTIKKRIGGPSLVGFIKSLISIRTVYLVIFVVATLILILCSLCMSSQSADVPQTRQSQAEADGADRSAPESEKRKDYQPGDKED